MHFEQLCTHDRCVSYWAISIVEGAFGEVPLAGVTAVVVYDPDAASINPKLPKPGTGLRWHEFIEALATAYRARFEI